MATNTINGKSYVGMTKHDFEQRKYMHLFYQKNPKHYFHRALKKYNADNFQWSILKNCITTKELCDWEKFYIKFFHTQAPNGYNLTNGGDGAGGLPLSEKTKKLLSDAAKKRYQRKDNPFYGKKHSEETKEKMRISQKKWRAERPGYNSGENNPMFGKGLRGEKNGMYGKKHTPEAIKKISDHSKKQIPWNKNKKWSEEEKKKRSIAMKKKWEDPGHRKKMTPIIKENFAKRKLKLMEAT